MSAFTDFTAAFGEGETEAALVIDLLADVEDRATRLLAISGLLGRRAKRRGEPLPIDGRYVRRVFEALEAALVEHKKGRVDE